MECEGFCPYCGEQFDPWIDDGGGPSQSYIEDCPVCCRPIQIDVFYDEEGQPHVVLRSCDD
jgi:hypothetical protein